MHEAARASPSKLVLVVDDCDDSNATWSLLLGMWGFAVEVASDGESAVRKAAEGKPAAVLLDLSLPRLDGYEVARRIRAQDGPRPLLIALTGMTRPCDLSAARDADFDLYVIKPADPERIHRILESHFSGIARPA